MDVHGLRNRIDLYFHCRRCLAEKPDDVSARDYSRLECGSTPDGFQVWCVRHDCNVIYLDLTEPDDNEDGC